VRERLAVDGDDDAERVDVERVTAAMLEDESVSTRVRSERHPRGRCGLAGRDADRERDGDAAREHDRERHREDDADDRTRPGVVRPRTPWHAERSRGFALEPSHERNRSNTPNQRPNGGRRTRPESVRTRDGTAGNGVLADAVRDRSQFGPATAPRETASWRTPYATGVSSCPRT
jgi:hypothetical protein